MTAYVTLAWCLLSSRCAASRRSVSVTMMGKAAACRMRQARARPQRPEACGSTVREVEGR